MKPPFTGTNRHSLYKNVLKAPIALPERLSLAAKDILMQVQRSASYPNTLTLTTACIESIKNMFKPLSRSLRLVARATDRHGHVSLSRTFSSLSRDFLM